MQAPCRQITLDCPASHIACPPKKPRHSRAGGNPCQKESRSSNRSLDTRLRGYDPGVLTGKTSPGLQLSPMKVGLQPHIACPPKKPRHSRAGGNPWQKESRNCNRSTDTRLRGYGTGILAGCLYSNKISERFMLANNRSYSPLLFFLTATLAGKAIEQITSTFQIVKK